MRGPEDYRTVSGNDVATVSEGPQMDQTRGGVSPVGPDTSGMIGREILGQYRVLSKLGRGGMGTVFLAQQMGMNRQVAIKVLHPEVGDDPDAARRFHIEAQASARLASPNIVSVFNFGQLDTGELYLAMEYLPGKTLHAEVATYGRLPLARVVHLVRQIARGLDEAHRKGVIHRDLKPGNIMLVPGPEEEVAKLLDFGIAKLDTGVGTQTQGWVGTPRYMAPEQFTGEAIDARTDVYALGLIAYEMLCGRTPFLSDNPMSYVHSHVYAAVPSMESVAPGAVPPSVESTVLAALSKQPQHRPSSAGEFAQALANSVHSPPRGRRASNAPVVAAVGAAVLGVGLLGGGGAFAYQRLSSEEPSAGVQAPSSAESSVAEQPPVKVAHIPAGSAQDFDPEYLAQLPKEFRELVDLEEKALLKRLDALLLIYPPSMRAQSRSQYTLQLASMPGADRVVSRKVVLISGIVSMASAAKHFPQDSRSTDELVADYLTREGPIPKESRKEIVDAMREGVPDPADRDWTIRQWLLQLEAQEKKSAQQ